MREQRVPIPLVPRTRIHGTPLGELGSARRGDGVDVIGVRAYRRGDDLRRIDQRASARASWASGSDVFLVREFYAQEAPRLVVVVDTAPTMQLYPAGLPWLRKPLALRQVVDHLLDSALEARASVGCLRAGAWWPPLRRPRPQEWLAACTSGPLASDLETLAAFPRLGKGTFVFVVSDFLEPPAEDAWLGLLARGWDPVPVVLQDPTWERSFPTVGGRTIPISEADGSATHLVRLTRRECAALRAEHEARFEATVDAFRALSLEPVCVDSHDDAAVHRALSDWAAARAGGLR
jgi:uncharacterized protein (DUF58 family)